MAKLKKKAELKASQLSDPLISVVYKWKECSTRPKREEVSHMNVELKTYWSQWDRLVLNDGFLYRIWKDTNLDLHIAQVVLPLSLRREVFTMLHAVPTDGHFGVLRRDSIGLIIKEISCNGVGSVRLVRYTTLLQNIQRLR